MIKLNKIGISPFLAVLYMSFTMVGSITSSYMYISVALFGTWLLVSFFSKNYISILRDKKTSLLFLYLIIAFIYGLYLAPLEFSLKVFFEALMMFSPFFMFDLYKNDIPTLKVMTIMLIISQIGVSVGAIIFYHTIGEMYGDLYGESAARVVTSDRDAFDGMIIGGGYCIAYAGALFACVLVGMYLAKFFKSTLEKVFAIFCVFISLLLVVKTESTITTISLVLGLLFTVVFRRSSQNKPAIILLFSIMFVICYLSANLIGEYLIEISKNMDGVSGRRYASLGATLIGKGGDSEYTSYRFMIPFDTLATFLSNPLFGVSYLHGNGFYSPEGFGVGNHCEWSDALADYGLVGGIPYLLIYYKQIKELTKTGIYISPGWIICFFLIGFFNPFRGFQSHIMLFFIIPSMLKIYSNIVQSRNNYQYN